MTERSRFGGECPTFLGLVYRESPYRPKGGPVYIGIGTLVFILVILLIIWLVRRGEGTRHSTRRDVRPT